uniref:NlpC/P60 domain-containing protein n=1 Tax=Gracilinema caldarium TaxID=215591 RepID=A0A7C3I834_9SPIR
MTIMLSIKVNLSKFVCILKDTLHTMSNNHKVVLLIITILSFLISNCAINSDNFLKQIEVTDIEAKQALDLALSKINSVYLWGGNGTDSFDCSGLIVWSYQNVFKDNYIFTNGIELVNDVTINELYNFNANNRTKDNVKPGDIIFISNMNDFITHGGLVIEAKENSVKFINASSYYEKVIIDEWDYNELVRGQWIVGFGRVLRSKK